MLAIISVVNLLEEALSWLDYFLYPEITSLQVAMSAELHLSACCTSIFPLSDDITNSAVLILYSQWLRIKTAFSPQLFSAYSLSSSHRAMHQIQQDAFAVKSLRIGFHSNGIAKITHSAQMQKCVHSRR